MDGIKIWQNIITYRKAEYPNICMLVSLIICLAGSNSSVERAFSVLTLILSDRRLALRHDTIRNLMLIKCNDRNWSFDEKEQIIHNALDAYFEKRRTTIIVEEEFVEPPKKVMIVADNLSSSDSDEENAMLELGF